MNLRQAVRTDPRDWTADDLAPLRAEYGHDISCPSADLCRLMGIPHSGTKPAKIARLRDAADLRGILATYNKPDAGCPLGHAVFQRRDLALPVPPRWSLRRLDQVRDGRG